MASKSCVLFQSLLPKMLREMEPSVRDMGTEEAADFAFEMLGIIVAKKTEKVASTRWIQVVMALRVLITERSARLSMCLHLRLLAARFAWQLQAE